MPVVIASLAVLIMVAAQVLVTFFERMVTIVNSISHMDVFTKLTIALHSVPDRIVIGYFIFRIQQNNKKIDTQISVKISTRSRTQTLLPIASAPLAVFLMVVAHVLVSFLS